MVSFPPYTPAEITRDLRERRFVVLIGQRRSGLTHWTTTTLFQIYEQETIKSLDLGQVGRDVDRFIEAVRITLKLTSRPVAPSDLMPILASHFGVGGKAPVVLLSNLHSASIDVLQWILRSLLNPVVDSEDIGFAFIAEGAVDLDALLYKTFPSGLTDAPLVKHASDPAPWHSMVEFEALLNAQRPRLPLVLVAFLLDITGGDVHLAGELLRRLPEVEWIDEATFQSACAFIRDRSVTATELRNITKDLSDIELSYIKRLVNDEVIWGAPPSNIAQSELRRLYLDGIAIYDPIVRGYRIRSPLIADIIKPCLDNEASSSFKSGHSVTSYLIWQVANIELTLRSLVSKHDFLQVAKEVTTPMQWQGAGKRIRAGIAAYLRSEAIAPPTTSFTGQDVTPPQEDRIEQPQMVSFEKILGILNDIIKKELPDKQTIIEAACLRLSATDATSSEQVLSGFTFDELITIASKVGIVDQERRRVLERIRDIRNSVAHFRQVLFQDAAKLNHDIRDVLERLSKFGRGTAGRSTGVGD